MFEQFSESTRRVIVLAQRETVAMSHDQLGTEHLLLGLLAEHGIAARVLAGLGVSYEQARAEVLRAAGEDETVTSESSSYVAFSAETKRAFERALREALALGRNDVCPDSLLLALVADRESVATRVLLACGVDAQAIRDEHALQIMAEQATEPVSSVDMDRSQFDFSPEEAFTLAGRLSDLASEIRFEVRRHGDREPTFRVSCELLTAEHVVAGLAALKDDGIVAILDHDRRARLAHRAAH